jgi:hypothetical protein
MKVRVNLMLPSLLTPGTKALYPLNRGLNGPLGLYIRFGEEKNLFLLEIRKKKIHP